MTETKHTPGTWFYEAIGRGYVVRVTLPHYTGNGEILAKGIERADDARLLVAAPDLLQAAKLALYEMRHTIAPRDSFTDAVEALDAAITKAEAP